jgi:acetyltransferase-like isoleucine patch superfamily enzyme
VIYPNVEIGEGTVIANDCVIGEPSGDYYENPQYNQPKTIIGKNCLIRSHSIVYAGCRLGNQFQTGHRVCIRERTMIGDDCRVGTLCDLQGDLSIGNSVWLHSNVHIGKGAEIASFVFIYPYVVLTNDPYPPSSIQQGVRIGEYSQIGASSTLMPGIWIGHDVLIGAGSNVTKNIPDFSLAMGNPARVIRDVRELKLPDGTIAYPWPYRFDRGMPWAGIGYQNWLNQQES